MKATITVVAGGSILVLPSLILADMVIDLLIIITLLFMPGAGASGHHGGPFEVRVLGIQWLQRGDDNVWQISGSQLLEDALACT